MTSEVQARTLRPSELLPLSSDGTVESADHPLRVPFFPRRSDGLPNAENVPERPLAEIIGLSIGQ